jgi:hypothetical protein
MINKASVRCALILATGAFVLCASPVMAVDNDGSAANATSSSQAAPASRPRSFRHTWHHRRHYAHRRIHAIARAVDEKADDEKTAAPAAATSDNKALPEMPSSIANANAQMLLTSAQIGAAAAIPSGTGTSATPSNAANASGEFAVAASDQLNDADKNLQESGSTATATATPPPAPAMTMSGESSIWDQTSLIGKIFIGFGALLTVASAARMFIT